MEKVLAQAKLNVTEEGYLTDFSQWTNEIGFELAKEQGITMTDEHWKVIDYLQEQYKNNDPLSIRGIKKSGVINVKEFYGLFPSGPLKKSDFDRRHSEAEELYLNKTEFELNFN